MNWEFIAAIFPRLLKAAGVTVELTIIGVAFGTMLGLALALGRISGNRPMGIGAKAYIDFFRGTPLMVQIMIIHYAVFPLFFTPIKFLSAIVALGFNSAAYVAEIFRAGIQSIDRGQMEAARSLGMTWWQAMRYVILPQALKVSIPPLGNEFIALLKDSSLVTIIGVVELLTQGRLIMGRTPRAAEIWFTVAVLYLVMTQTIAYFVNRAERRLANDRS